MMHFSLPAFINLSIVPIFLFIHQANHFSTSLFTHQQWSDKTFTFPKGWHSFASKTCTDRFQPPFSCSHSTMQNSCCVNIIISSGTEIYLTFQSQFFLYWLHSLTVSVFHSVAQVYVNAFLPCLPVSCLRQILHSCNFPLGASNLVTCHCHVCAGRFLVPAAREIPTDAGRLAVKGAWECANVLFYSWQVCIDFARELSGLKLSLAQLVMF